jgi:hypothetical protein
MPNHETSRREDSFLLALYELSMAADEPPDADSPTEQLSAEYLRQMWTICREGLLAKTKRIRVTPQRSAAPHIFRFEIDCPYKRKRALDAPVELMPGPVCGTIIYRRDVYADVEAPGVVVLLDSNQDYLHPNYSRRYGVVCLGDLPPGPLPLDILLENHLFPILSYQNRRPAHPADREAASYFALDPDAMNGLEPVEPLY